MHRIGGMSRAATATYKRLAALVAEKRDKPYSTTMGWIRCRLSFSLLRASIMCFRGARSSIGQASKQPDAINLVSSDGRVYLSWNSSRNSDLKIAIL